MNTIVDFYRTDPLVAWFLTAGLLVLLAGALYAIWLASEEETATRKATQDARDRLRLQHSISAIVTPPPLGSHRTPWKSTRKDVA